MNPVCGFRLISSDASWNLERYLNTADGDGSCDGTPCATFASALTLSATYSVGLDCEQQSAETIVLLKIRRSSTDSPPTRFSSTTAAESLSSPDHLPSHPSGPHRLAQTSGLRHVQVGRQSR